MIILRNQAGVIGSYSWTTGFCSVVQSREDIRKEASRNLEAVINRLLLQGRDDEAEDIFDEFA